MAHGGGCEAADVSTRTGPSADASSTEPVDASASTELLPWHRSVLNLALLALAIAVLAGGAGYLVGNNRAIPDPNGVDVGFLQDMRYHHEQGVEIALIYLDRPETFGGLRVVARDVVIGQQLEVGRMIQLLRGFGESEVNETETAMTWMGEPVPLERMPGLAAEADIDVLRGSAAADADAAFVALMVAHHQGGIHMAEHAAEFAGTDEVRKMAASIVEGQQAEITELQQLLPTAST